MRFAAFAARAAKQCLSPYEYEPASLRPQDVEIQISHCGICHSDLHLIDNDWSSSTYPLVPGHEIVGTVMTVGGDCSLAVGQRVGVGWQRSACFDCEQCRAGAENLCARQEATCVGHMGGFARRIWDGPNNLPTYPELRDPALWLTRMQQSDLGTRSGGVHE